MYYCLSCKSFFKDSVIENLDKLGENCPNQYCNYEYKYKNGDKRKINEYSYEVIILIDKLNDMNYSIRDIEVKNDSIKILLNDICKFESEMLEILEEGLQVSYYYNHSFLKYITEISYKNISENTQRIQSIVKLIQKAS